MARAWPKFVSADDCILSFKSRLLRSDFSACAQVRYLSTNAFTVFGPATTAIAVDVSIVMADVKDMWLQSDLRR